MNTLHRSMIALVAFALLTTMGTTAFAQAPASLPIQGYLTDAEGAPIDGSASLTFTIYNAGGDSLYTTTTNATLDRGAFSVLLGDSDAIDLAIFRDNTVLQLGVAVDGGAELSPRFDIATSPFAGFAQYAGDALTLEGVAATDFARVGQIDFADLQNIPTGVDDGDNDTVGDLACQAGDVPTWDGTAWICGTASDTVGDLNCATGQVAKYDGAAWVCTGEFAIAANLATVATSGSFADLVGVPADLADGDQDTTYTAGTGITLTGTEFSLNAAALDGRFVNTGEANSITSAMIAAGAVGTSDLADNAVTSAKVAANSLTAADLAANSVAASEIATGAVGSSEVADNSLTANDLATNSVGTAEIAQHAVGASELDTDVVAADFAPATVCPIADTRDLPTCNQVVPGAFCDYDGEFTGLDNFLDNCATNGDIYVRLNW